MSRYSIQQVWLHVAVDNVGRAGETVMALCCDGVPVMRVRDWAHGQQLLREVRP
jgi:hypothetical protein